MQIIPLQATANQTLGVVLGGQVCQLNVYQKSTGLFIDLYSNAELVIAGAPGLNATPIVITPYLGFSGDIAFYDTSGAGEDPTYTGLGARFVLYYLTASDVSAYQAQVQAANLSTAIASYTPTGNFVFGTSGFGVESF